MEWLSHILRRSRRGGTRALATDERGATLVEFAFVAGPLVALLVAVLQTSLTFFAQQSLDTAGEKATRQIMTGAAQTSGMTQAQFKTLVCSDLPSFMKCANVMVDIQSASSFSAVNTATPTLTYDASGNPNNSWQYSPGTSGQISVARVMYVWNVSQGPLGFDLSTMSGGRRLLVSTSVLKTEPYS